MFVQGMVLPSTVDEIGKISATIFVSGCNFNCTFCHNHRLIPCTAGLDTDGDEIIDRIVKSNLIDCVVITGGEPTLQDDLGDFIVRLRLSKNVPVYLNTNGYYPDRLVNLLPLVDGVAMDFKCGFGGYKDVANVEKFDIDRIKKSIDMLIEHDKTMNERERGSFKLEFRTTVVLPLISNKEVDEITRYLATKQFTGFYALQQFSKENVRDRWKSKLKQMKTNDMIKMGNDINGKGFNVFLRTLNQGIVKVNF